MKKIILIMLCGVLFVGSGCSDDGSGSSDGGDTSLGTDNNGNDTDRQNSTDPDDTEKNSDNSDLPVDSDEKDSSGVADTDDTDKTIDTEKSDTDNPVKCLEPLPVDNIMTMTQLIDFSASGITVQVLRYDDPDMVGTSGTTPWVGAGFSISGTNGNSCVATPEDLDYVASYHNFDDAFNVDAGDTSYIFKQTAPQGYSGPVVYTLSASGTNGFSEITLSMDGCYDYLLDGDCAGFQF